MPTRKRVPGAFVCAFICIAAGGPVHAQTAPTPLSELTLEHLVNVEVETVFGASRFLQRVTDAPASVSIITREEIERFGYRTFSEILRGIRGFYVSNDRNYSFLGVRGFGRPGDYNTRVLVLVDGHRLNENVFDSALIGTEFQLDVDLIERIEVVRGPGSSLYGTNAFFSVINVVTRSARTVKQLEVSLEGGSQATRAASAVFGREFQSGTGLVLGASAYGSDGDRTFTIPDFGTSHGMDDDQAFRVFGNLSRRGWTMQGLFSSREKRIPTGAFGTSIDDPRSQTTDARGYLDVKYDGAWRGTALLWRGAFDTYDYDGVYASEPSADYPGLLTDAAWGRWLSTETVLSRRMRRHFLTGGGEFRYNLRQDQFSEAPETGEVTVDARNDSAVLAGFLQDEYAVSRWLTLSGGLRYDWYSSLEGTTNLRAAAIVKPRPQAALKLLHGTAFRAPNAYELYYYPPQERLQPETIRTTEIVWEQYFRNHLRLSASAFRYDADQLISQTLATAALDDIVFVNVDHVEASASSWRRRPRIAACTRWAATRSRT